MKGVHLPHLPHLPEELPLLLDRWVRPEYRLTSLMILCALAVHAAFILLVPVREPAVGRPVGAGPEVTLVAPSARAVGAQAMPDWLFQLTFDDPTAIALPRRPAGALSPRFGLPPAATAGASRIEEMAPAGAAGTEAAPLAERLGAMRPRLTRTSGAIWEGDLPEAATAVVVGEALAPRWSGAAAPDVVKETDRPLQSPRLRVAVEEAGGVAAVFVEQTSGSVAADNEAVAWMRRQVFAAAPGAGLRWGVVTVFWAQRAPADRPAAGEAEGP